MTSVLWVQCLKLEHHPSTGGKRKIHRQRKKRFIVKDNKKKGFTRSDSTPLKRVVGEQFGKSSCLNGDSPPRGKRQAIPGRMDCP
jgi:hypothetical protein